jgi:hypothetical protein
MSPAWWVRHEGGSRAGLPGGAAVSGPDRSDAAPAMVPFRAIQKRAWALEA